MSSISALANVHTKGQFGDYKDKHENNLTLNGLSLSKSTVNAILL